MTVKETKEGLKKYNNTDNNMYGPLSGSEDKETNIMVREERNKVNVVDRK